MLSSSAVGEIAALWAASYPGNAITPGHAFLFTLRKLLAIMLVSPVSKL